MKQRAIIRLTWEGLGALLRLPEDMEIIDVFSERGDRLREQIEIKVSGTTLPKKLEGHEIAWIPIEDERYFPKEKA